MEEKKTFFSSQNPTLFQVINMILLYLLHQMLTVSLDFYKLVDFDEWNLQYNQCSININQKMSLYHKVFAYLSHHTGYLLNPSELVLKSPKK